MKHFAMLLVVLGVCFGALGSSGFHTPLEAGLTREEYALPLFVAGVASICLGGFMARWLREEAASSGDFSADLGVYREQIDQLQRSLAHLNEDAGRQEPEELRASLGELLDGDFLELTSKGDDLIALVGFTNFALVWEGVAVAERLLARAWSMCTDGHTEEGILELGHALVSIEQAQEAMHLVAQPTAALN